MQQLMMVLYHKLRTHSPKRKRGEYTVYPDMHIILVYVIAPIHGCKHHFKVYYFTQLTKQPNVYGLATHDNFFFCSLLEMCNGKDEDPSKYTICDINVQHQLPKPQMITSTILPGVCTIMYEKRQRRDK